MTTQPTALRLADLLDADLPIDLAEAAAELRQLHQFAEEQIGRATAAEAALQMTKATHALKIAALERQRGALLEALRKHVELHDGDCICEDCAAIAAVEDGK